MVFCCSADWQSADRSLVRRACGLQIESRVKAAILQTLARGRARLVEHGTASSQLE